MTKFSMKVTKDEDREECDWCGKRQNQFGDPKMVAIGNWHKGYSHDKPGDSIHLCSCSCEQELVRLVMNTKTERIKSINRSVTCESCKGKGYHETLDSDHDPVEEECFACEGTGRFDPGPKKKKG